MIMYSFHKFPRLIELLSILIFCFILFGSGMSAAMTISVISDELPQEVNQETLVGYSIEISGIPKQTSILELTTDLSPVSDSPLWTINSDSLMLKNSTPNDPIIRLESTNGFADSLVINVTGYAPRITNSVPYGNVVITTRERQTDYIFYSVKALDANGDSLEKAVTKTFFVAVPSDQELTGRINSLDDPTLRLIAQDLYDKGLIQETIDIVEYGENSNSQLSLILIIVASIVAFVIGVVGALFFVSIKGRNSEKIM